MYTLLAKHGQNPWGGETTTTPRKKNLVFSLTPEASLITKSQIDINFNRICIGYWDFWLDFAGSEFYKPLASSLHPAGAFSSVETTFLDIFNMCPIIFSCVFDIFLCLQALVQEAASSRGFFPPENFIPGSFEHGYCQKTCFFSWGL